MKTKLIMLSAMFTLIAGLGFAGPRLELDLGADFQVFPRIIENLYPDFRYDVQLRFPVYSELELFFKGGQSFAVAKPDMKRTLVSTVLFGFDYSFFLTENDSLRPAFALGPIFIQSDGSPDLQIGLSTDFKLFYDRKLTKKFLVNLGLGMSFMFYEHVSPIDTYSPLDVTLGVVYKL